ncbi:hypothetical protein HY637_00845 [Candidatus Woesearchaeota archaeon]|nr:hypothetical protein [Candidatus Woesearchaeota archaeon]
MNLKIILDVAFSLFTLLFTVIFPLINLIKLDAILKKLYEKGKNDWMFKLYSRGESTQEKYRSYAKLFYSISIIGGIILLIAWFTYPWNY